MENLIELSNIITTSKVRYLDLIGINDDKVENLYQLISSGAIKSNESARNSLYSDSRYPEILLSNAKKKLEDRLCNTLLTIHNPGRTEIQKIYYEVYRKFSVFKILRGQGKRKASVKIGEKVVKLAIRYGLTEVALSLARELRIHYSIATPNKKAAQYYSDLINKYNKIIQDEILIEEYYCKIVGFLMTKKSFTKNEIREAGEIVKLCKEINEESFWIVLLKGNIQVYFYQITNNYKKVTEICKKTIEHFEALPYQSPAAAFFSFSFKMIPYYVILEQFHRAEEEIQRCLTIVGENNVNWIKIKHYETLLYFRKGEYENAHQVISYILRKDKNAEEYWIILNAYSSFLLGEKIKLGKFLNQVPVYSNDKRGMNINILIIQILVYLSRTESGKAIDRFPALKRYSYRYLRKDDTYRSNCFIHMLLSLEQGHFNKIAVQRHAKKYITALKKIPLSQTTQDVDVEIVPYEKLWEVILGYLD